MVLRTIRLGGITYKATDGSVGAFGTLRQQVDVHEDDLERFDRYNPSADEIEPEPVAEPPFPEGDPSDTWTVKQIDAYAVEHQIDLGKVTKKDEKLALIMPPVK